MEGKAAINEFIEKLYIEFYEELHRYCAMQFRFSYQYMPMVDDIVQEVFFKAFLNVETVMIHPNPMGWLCSACRFMCMSIIRRDLRRRDIVGISVPLDDCNDFQQRMDDIMRWAEKQEDIEVLETLKKTLTPMEMKVYEAYYERGASDRETAEKLDMTLVAVRGVLQRIRNKAKKLDFVLIMCTTYPILGMLRTILCEGRQL